MHCCIVKRNIKFSSVLPIILILALTVVISVILSQIFNYLHIIALVIGFIIALYTAPGFLKTEYEYNIEGDTFSVAIIRNNSSRKEIFAADVQHLVSCQPYNTGSIPGIKIDASSSVNSMYVAVFKEDEKTASVVFSPDESFIQGLRLIAPLKVKLI